MDFAILLISAILMLGVAALAAINSVKRESVQLKNSIEVPNDISKIRRGYAYTVDMGDSLLVVAVIDKSSSGIMFSKESPLEVRSIAD